MQFRNTCKVCCMHTEGKSVRIGYAPCLGVSVVTRIADFWKFRARRGSLNGSSDHWHETSEKVRQLKCDEDMHGGRLPISRRTRSRKPCLDNNALSLSICSNSCIIIKGDKLAHYCSMGGHSRQSRQSPRGQCRKRGSEEDTRTCRSNH